MASLMSPLHWLLRIWCLGTIPCRRMCLSIIVCAAMSALFVFVFEWFHPEGVAVDVVYHQYGPFYLTGDVWRILCLIRVYCVC